jgi:outer membrane protein TolC
MMPVRNGLARSRRAARVARLALAALLGCCAGGGCRSWYREAVDREVGGIEAQRITDWRWDVRLRDVAPHPEARFRDPDDPDRHAFNPDDPAAHEFQVSERLHPWQGFDHRIAKRGLAPIEDVSWLATLPRNAKGEVPLSRETAMQLAVRHSRLYQTRYEDLFLASLGVSLARFEYAVQPFYNQGVAFQHFGTGVNDSNQVLPTAAAGLRKQFYSGGELLVEFANNLVFEYNGEGFSTARSNLSVALTQPLLRGAFARIATQPLSLLERGLLYSIRDFARFRRAFYVDTVAQGGYLGLLQLVQGIRNAEENLRNLERNLAESGALEAAGFVSRAQRDQVEIQYQQAQIGLLQQRANLETRLDAFRVQLGLPPDLPMTIDDAPLKTFELESPRIAELREANDALYLALLQTDETPPREELSRVAAELEANLEALAGVAAEVRPDLDRWRRAVGQVDDRGERPLPEPPDDPVARFEFELAANLATAFAEAEAAIPEDLEAVRALRARLPATAEARLADDWKALRDLVGDRYRVRLSDVFQVQVQAKVFLIELPRVDLTVEQAERVAIANRQDLMNAQARVADSWRNVEVAANALQSGLSVNYLGNLATDPNFDGILRFDASASLHRVGFQFDAPIVRRAERNAYRAAQIDYQRARRAYMLTQDEIVQQIRFDIRILDLSRRQFAISREQFVTAARAVEQSEIDLRTSRNLDSGLTLILLNSLGQLLQARNELIGNWVSYETARLGLFRDLDIMDIDAQGAWTNESLDAAALVGPGLAPGPGLDPVAAGVDPGPALPGAAPSPVP